MPTIFGAALLAAGGYLAWRYVRREWTRVNADLDRQRMAGAKPGERVVKLERDPETGAYRPAADND